MVAADAARKPVVLATARSPARPLRKAVPVGARQRAPCDDIFKDPTDLEEDEKEKKKQKKSAAHLAHRKAVCTSKLVGANFDTTTNVGALKLVGEKIDEKTATEHEKIDEKTATEHEKIDEIMGATWAPGRLV